MAPHLLIFPCNGNAVEALDCIGSTFEVLGFVDDTAAKQASGCHGLPVFGREALQRWPDALVLAVPGSPCSYLTRSQVIASLGLSADRWARVIHPAAHLSTLATLGRNVLVMAGVVVTSNAVIGDHVCLLPNTVVHHDSHIGAYSLVGANVSIAGHVTVGENCYIGSGSCLKNDITIGAGSLIGLGSTVIRDVPPGSRVAGNPARMLGPAGR
ncbi:MAG: NeuD/PglB/VioB family sugar acetyltransferase [Burkholderiales bacterium]|nr:NeuD/PglB/VioB family sugar acetyltransferase [Burkholderiales bacterium]